MLGPERHPVWPGAVTRRTFASGAALAVGLQPTAGQAQRARTPIGVDEIIQFRRLESFHAGSPIFYSPSATRYLLVVREADLSTGGVWMEFYSGDVQGLGRAEPFLAARLFTNALGDAPVTYNNEIRWISDDRVAFLWNDRHDCKQAYALHLATRDFRQLTGHHTNVRQFAVSSTDRTVFLAPRPRDLRVVQQMQRTGYVVESADGFQFINGNIDGWDETRQLELLTGQRSGRDARALQVEGHAATETNVLQISLDGHLVAVGLRPAQIPPEWDAYTNAAFRRIHLPQARTNPSASRLSRLCVVALNRSARSMVWAPPLTFSARAVWADDHRFLAIGPTFLPISSGSELGLDGLAVAILDAETGDFQELELQPSEQRGYRFAPTSFQGAIVELVSSTSNGRRILFERHGTSWIRVRRGNAAPSPRSIQLRIAEDLNTPPSVIAIDALDGRTRTVLDLNPGFLDRFAIGRVEEVSWTDRMGLRWFGNLYYPPNYRPDQPYPLVIQSYLLERGRFSLIGDEGRPSTFVAQALTSRNMMVLQMGAPEGGLPSNSGATPAEPRVYASGFESAVQHLSQTGRVDRHRVGLSGFSRSGWWVQHALAHSDVPFAAALCADNIDAGYVQAALSQWPEEYSTDNGAPAFEAGLAAWLEESPGFNADRIRTPLRLQANSAGTAGVIAAWELFGRLRTLNRPVELYVAPQIDLATHNLQNPIHLKASLSGAVEWFDFWLNDNEGPASNNNEQYPRWRHLRNLRDQMRQQPRRPPLEWLAQPSLQGRN